MNYNERIAPVLKMIEDKDFENAKNELKKMLEEETIKNIEDEEFTHYSLNNYIEWLMINTIYRLEKPNRVTNYCIDDIYYRLGYISVELENYKEAIEYIEMALKWNPVNAGIMFEKSIAYKLGGQIERFKAEIDKTHKYIYDRANLSRFYRELGWYFSERRVFDVANALYSYSTIFMKTHVAENELEYIAKQENREIRYSTNEEIKKLFNDYNIPMGFNGSLFNLLHERYKILKEKNGDAKAIEALSKVLYDITLDKKFLNAEENNKESQNENNNVEVNESKTDNLKLYVKETKFCPTFKFYFPEGIGEYYEKNKYSSIFELMQGNTQKVRVMISKCISEDDFQAFTRKWIEMNKKDNNMEIVSYKKERINNIPLEVYVMRYPENKKLKDRVYKSGYVHGHRIIISGELADNKEEIINQAFEKIEWEEKEWKTDDSEKEIFSQVIDGYPTFKFYLPKDLGKYTKLSEKKFALLKGTIQKITIDIWRCESEENLESEAKNWIEKFKVDNDMEEILYRKEKIGKIPIETYILRYNNKLDWSDRIYKIGYVNGYCINIYGWLVDDREYTINGAFEKLEWEENKKKEEISSAIVVKCPSCNNDFKLNWNVPASEKSFYCICPNCNKEIKCENPNYKNI